MAYVNFYNGPAASYNADTHAGGIYQCTDTNDTYVFGVLNKTLIPATADAVGGVMLGYTASGKNYPVQVDQNKAFVNIPWTDTTYSNATQDTDGLMSSEDKTKLDAIETTIDNKIAELVDSAPGALDTLNELAAALGDDPNFATTVTEQIATKQDQLVSGTNIKTVAGESLLGSGNIAIEPNDITLDLSNTHYLTDQTNIEDSLKTLDNLIYEIAQAITLKQY